VILEVTSGAVCDMKDLAGVGSQEEALGLGLLFASLVSVTILTVGLLWGRKKTLEEDMVEDLDSTKNDFEEINQLLQDNLKDHIGKKVEVVKMEMKVKRLEMDRKMGEVRKKETDELTLLEERYKREREEVENRYQKDIEKISQESQAEEESLLASLRDTKLVLARNGERVEAEVIEQGRGELECPVCMEEMKPPRRIWQCSDGHPVCEFCRRKPEVNCCPTCRKYLVGRSTIAEKLARALYSVDPGDERQERTEEPKITLSGYREVKISRETIQAS